MNSNDIMNKVCQWLDDHRDDLVEDTKKLIEINSEKAPAKEGMPFGEGPAKALAAAAEIMEKHGMTVRNYDNYVVTGDLNDKKKTLDILAHTDVVPVSPEDWTVTAPFTPIVIGDNLYGRGSSDDKGPAMAALYAMDAVKSCGAELSGNVRLILGSDEECGSSDIEYYYKTEEEAPYTFSPDAEFPVINIEKGGMMGLFSAEFVPSEASPKVTSFKCGQKINVIPGKAYADIEGISKAELEAYAEKSAAVTGMEFTITEENGICHVLAIGKSAHASMPEGGNNALTGMLSFLDTLPLAECDMKTKIHELNRLLPHGDGAGKALGVAMEDAESGALTLSFDLIEMDAKGFSGAFDCRAPICANDKNCRLVVKKNFEAVGISLKDEPMREPHNVPGDSYFVKTLLECYEKHSGKKGEPMAIGGGTYVHHLKNGVAFGCGELGVDTKMHGDDEFMPISQLILSAKIFAEAIVRLCK